MHIRVPGVLGLPVVDELCSGWDKGNHPRTNLATPASDLDFSIILVGMNAPAPSHFMGLPGRTTRGIAVGSYSRYLQMRRLRQREIPYRNGAGFEKGHAIILPQEVMIDH